MNSITKKLIKEDLFETIKPIEEYRNLTWYHGTSYHNIDSILTDKCLKPSTYSRARLAPMQNCVYLTANLEEALSYAFYRSGKHFDYELPSNDSPTPQYAYVIEVDGQNLNEVYADEDIIADILNSEKNRLDFNWVFKMAQYYEFTLYNKYKVKGNYDLGTQLGKRLMKHISDNQMIELINHGRKIAHYGPVNISHIWKIDMNMFNELSISEKEKIRKKPSLFSSFSTIIY